MKDYDKAKESTEPAPKGHAAAVREAIEDGKTRDSHPAQHAHVPATPPSRKMTGGPGGDIL